MLATCAPGAAVIWPRSRRASDLTPAIRRWLQDRGAAFAEQAFHAPEDVTFSVGVPTPDPDLESLDGRPTTSSSPPSRPVRSAANSDGIHAIKDLFSNTRSTRIGT